jgi:hypothetical protein
MVAIPTVMMAPTMMMVRVMMIPGAMMPRMLPVVDGVMMRQGMIPPPMMPTMCGRVVRVSGFCMAMVAVPAVSVRMMSSMSMPAMSALGKRRAAIRKHQSDDQRQSQQSERSHRSGPNSEGSI